MAQEIVDPSEAKVSPPPLQPPGSHVPSMPLHPSLVLPATLRVLPWITDAATDYIDTVIGLKRAASEAVLAIECGSGSSTVYLAQRVARLVSFDHDVSWQNAIRGATIAIGCHNVEWRCEERPYANHFVDYADQTFDLALIDGRDRTFCVDRVRRVLKAGAVLVVDNTERISGTDGRGPYYEILQYLEGWHAVHFEQPWTDRAGWTPPHRWITSVWRKPDASGASYTTLGRPL